MKRSQFAMLACVCMAGVIGGLAVRSASGMLQFKKVFEDAYIGGKKTPQQKALAKAVETAKCNVCHDPRTGKTKKDHNPYGQALKKLGLKKTDIKNVAKVVKILKAAESQKEASGGTYGGRLKKGKLPWEAE